MFVVLRKKSVFLCCVHRFSISTDFISPGDALLTSISSIRNQLQWSLGVYRCVDLCNKRTCSTRFLLVLQFYCSCTDTGPKSFLGEWRPMLENWLNHVILEDGC